MINRSFYDFHEYDYYRVDTVTPDRTRKFYSNRIDNLKKWLSDSVLVITIIQNKEYLVENMKKCKYLFTMNTQVLGRVFILFASIDNVDYVSWNILISGIFLMSSV